MPSCSTKSRRGALESIHLKVPTAWTARAQVERGDGLRLKVDTRGPSTIWNIPSDRPIWGTRRLVVRSTMPLSAGQEVQHPEIAPLGFGVADTYLGVVNATGAALTTAGSSGLHAITYASHFRSQEFGQLPSAESKAYRVDRDNWSLKVQIPPAAEPGEDSRDQSARVVSADVSVTVMPDRRLVGWAFYDVQPRTGPFLVTELPPGCTLLWSTTR